MHGAMLFRIAFSMVLRKHVLGNMFLKQYNSCSCGCGVQNCNALVRLTPGDMETIQIGCQTQNCNALFPLVRLIPMEGSGSQARAEDADGIQHRCTRHQCARRKAYLYIYVGLGCRVRVGLRIAVRLRPADVLDGLIDDRGRCAV